MRLYKTFKNFNEAKEFAKRMEQERRLAMVQFIRGSKEWSVVYFMSPEDRNGDLGGKYGERVEIEL